MALTKMTASTSNIQDLSNKPNEIEGLTPEELKKKFDDFAIDCKEYINETLTEEVDKELGYNNADSWVPLLGNRGTGGVPVVTYSERTGTYVRIGKIIFFTFRIKGTITAVNGQNYATIDGLPTISKSNIINAGMCYFSEYYQGSSASYAPLGIIYGNENRIRLQTSSSKGAAVEQYVPNLGGFEFMGAGFYYI